MVNLLQREQKNEKLFAIIVDCLRILAFQNPKTKEFILECKGPHLFVAILKTTEYKTLITMTSKLLKG
jgi:hypothetical protein